MREVVVHKCGALTNDLYLIRIYVCMCYIVNIGRKGHTAKTVNSNLREM